MTATSISIYENFQYVLRVSIHARVSSIGQEISQKIIGNDSVARQSGHGVDTQQSLVVAHRHQSAVDYSDLLTVATEWDTLSVTVQAAILAIANGAGR